MYDIPLVLAALLLQQWVASHIPSSPTVCAGLAFIGSMSLYLFLLNGFLRLPFRTVSVAHQSPLLDIVLAGGLVLISVVLGLGVRRLEGVLSPKILTKLRG